MAVDKFCLRHQQFWWFHVCINCFGTFYYFFLHLLFIYLAEPGLSWGMWDLVPQPEFEPGCPALGAQSLSHWTAREVPWNFLFLMSSLGIYCLAEKYFYPLFSWPLFIVENHRPHCWCIQSSPNYTHQLWGWVLWEEVMYWFGFIEWYGWGHRQAKEQSVGDEVCWLR